MTRESMPHMPDRPQQARRPWHKRHRALMTVLLIAHILGFVSSLHALMATRTSQGAIAWIVSLNALPYVAVPAYWVFGRSKFQGYVIARRDEDSVLAATLAETINELRTHHQASAPDRNGALEVLAKMPFTDGNRLELLVDGETTFESIFSGIESARDYILVQSYIIRDDSLGQEFQKRLIERARHGVRVYLLYDEIGSLRLPQRYLDELTDAGISVNWFYSTRGMGNRFQINFRNHRKMIVVDGARGWMGGFNIGSEYLDGDDQLGPWRDTHLKISGPAVLKLQLSFVEDWHWASEEILDLPWRPATEAGGNVPVLILASGPADRFETASLMVQHIIQTASHRVWISSPYFVPDEGVQNALKLAALAGTDVRILIPEKPDHRLTYYAAYAFIAPMLEAGVKIYRYQNGFLHSKVFLVDNDSAAVSTANLDNRSFRLNFEITALGLDETFAGEVETMFLADFERARLMRVEDLEAQSLWFRIASRMAYLVAPVL